MSTVTTSIEVQDAAKVDQAVTAIIAGKTADAEALLLAVIANTPAAYANSSEDPDGTLSIKFWDQQEFIHHVVWQKQHGTERRIRWVKNAYPRAHFYLGFIGVKTKQYKKALEYLEKGQTLESTNPKFSFEKAQALVHSGEKEKALELYQAIHELGPYVSARDLAISHRGRGFVLIELKRLDEAEEAFKSSLEIEPNSSIALGELRYIARLREGGPALPGKPVQTQPQNIWKCLVCGISHTKGTIVTIKDVPHFVCEKCRLTLPKT
jgi:tetratricopeptide (TPR) repeat protein